LKNLSDYMRNKTGDKMQKSLKIQQQNYLSYVIYIFNEERKDWIKIWEIFKPKIEDDWNIKKEWEAKVGANIWKL
jgi:hypothetical protein